MEKFLWGPSGKIKKESLLEDFSKYINIKSNYNFKNLWKWSVDHPEEFWSKFWDYSKIIGDKGKGHQGRFQGQLQRKRQRPSGPRGGRFNVDVLYSLVVGTGCTFLEHEVVHVLREDRPRSEHVLGSSGRLRTVVGRLCRQRGCAFTAQGTHDVGDGSFSTTGFYGGPSALRVTFKGRTCSSGA